MDFETLEEVRVSDVVVNPKGSLAWGTVTQAVPKRRMARGGKLDVNIDAVRLTNGEKASLRAVRGGKGEGPTGSMKGAKVATSLVVWPAAPFFPFVHGKEIVIPKGTEIRAYVNGNTDLDTASFKLKPGEEQQTGATTGSVSTGDLSTSANSFRQPGDGGGEINPDRGGCDGQRQVCWRHSLHGPAGARRSRDLYREARLQELAANHDGEPRGGMIAIDPTLERPILARTAWSRLSSTGWQNRCGLRSRESARHRVQPLIPWMVCQSLHAAWGLGGGRRRRRCHQSQALKKKNGALRRTAPN